MYKITKKVGMCATGKGRKYLLRASVFGAFDYVLFRCERRVRVRGFLDQTGID